MLAGQCKQILVGQRARNNNVRKRKMESGKQLKATLSAM
jgi:hypothetical protein